MNTTPKASIAIPLIVVVFVMAEVKKDDSHKKRSWQPISYDCLYNYLSSGRYEAGCTAGWKRAVRLKAAKFVVDDCQLFRVASGQHGDEERRL